jgi:Uma2 family endonuclease
MAEYRDLFDLPEHLIGEILHGQLITQPRPASKHAFACSLLGRRLPNHYYEGGQDSGGWWILFEPELHLGHQILVPDLAGWRRERMPVFPDVAFFTQAPDWVCEILSRGTARTDRVIKMPIYAEQGVPWLWLLDPDLRTLEVFRLQAGHWLLEGAWQEQELVQAPPFAEIVLPLGDLWAPTGAAPGVGT